MIYLIYPLHFLVCLFLILVVLLQQGKGADLSVFGGGATMTAFGARGSATLLHKLTVGSFVVFILTTLAIGVIQGKGTSRTVTEDEPAAAESPAPEPAPVAAPAAALPEDEGDGASAPAATLDGAAPATGSEAASGEAAPAAEAPPAEAPPSAGGGGR